MTGEILNIVRSAYQYSSLGIVFFWKFYKIKMRLGTKLWLKSNDLFKINLVDTLSVFMSIFFKYITVALKHITNEFLSKRTMHRMEIQKFFKLKCSEDFLFNSLPPSFQRRVYTPPTYNSHIFVLFCGLTYLQFGIHAWSEINKKKHFLALHSHHQRQEA